MSVILLFMVTAIISFIGSIPIGPVNLMVIKTSLQKDFKSALMLGLGGSLPELIYAAIALAGLSYLKQHQDTLDMINKLVVPFFIILGIYYFLLKNKRMADKKTTQSRSFSTGMLMGILNPQLLPFWFATLLYLHSFFPIESKMQQVAFILGTAAGAFGLLSLYAWLANFKKELLNVYLLKFNYDSILGITFFAMAFIKILV